MKRLAFVLGLSLWGGVFPAQAVEYRLQVANLYQSSFSHFLNGKIGRGEGELRMERLERSLDSAEVGAGAVLYRPVQVARETLAAAFAASKARGEVKPAEGNRRWDEVVWQGKPGERSVWVIAPSATHHQEVVHLAIKGNDTLRYYIPYGISGRARPATAVAFPLQFLQFYEERGNLWDRYLSKAVTLERGIAVVVGVNQNPTFADWVYIIVDHPSEPAPFKVVVGWERRRGTPDQTNTEGHRAP